MRARGGEKVSIFGRESGEAGRLLAAAFCCTSELARGARKNGTAVLSKLW